jgi:hypothetical protein
MKQNGIELRPIDCATSRGLIAESSVCVFCHSSYEDRCRAIERLELADKRVLFTALFSSSEYRNLPKYQSNTTLLNRWLKQKNGLRHHQADIHVDDVIGWLETLDDQLGAVAIPGETALLVDVTTFPRDRMYILLDYLLLKYPQNSLYISYFEPLEYSTDSGDEGWLSRDVCSVRSIPRLCGRVRIGAKRLLAIVVGHERTRAYGTIVTEEADLLVPFGQEKGLYRTDAPNIANAIIEQLCIDFQESVSREDIVYLHSRDVQSSEVACLKLHEKYGADHDISLISYGSKLQSLGVFFAARRKREIRMAHSKVQAYNADSYSRGIGSGWIAEIGRYALGNRQS